MLVIFLSFFMGTLSVFASEENSPVKPLVSKKIDISLDEKTLEFERRFFEQDERIKEQENKLNDLNTKYNESLKTIKSIQDTFVLSAKSQTGFVKAFNPDIPLKFASGIFVLDLAHGLYKGTFDVRIALSFVVTVYYLVAIMRPYFAMIPPNKPNVEKK